METPLEYSLTHSYKGEMIRYLAEHPEDFEEAIQLALSQKTPYSWRAAWLLWSCMEKNDPRIQPYMVKMVEVVPSMKDGHQRELFKILSVMELDEAMEGLLFNLCMNVWEQIHKQPSVRLNALLILFKFGRKYPELMPEIRLLTDEMYLETLSPGVRHSISKLLKEMPRD